MRLAHHWTWALVFGVILALSGSSSVAAKSLPYTFFMTHYVLLGDPNNPEGVRYESTGHPFAKAVDGSAITVSGQGAWDPRTKDVAGGGWYTVTDTAGNITTQGAWYAKDFVSFEQLGGWWGIPGFREEGWQGPPESSTFSGFLTLEVQLETLGPGELTAWCLMPDVEKPGDHVSDGISLVGRDFAFSDYHDSEMASAYEDGQLTVEGMMFYADAGQHAGGALNPAR